MSLAAGWFRPLVAQGNRDSLAAGSAAYDRADFPTAIRLLTIGLDPAAGPRDTAWVNGVHKLAHALIQTGDTTALKLWLAWANRAAPNFPIDTLLFPPPVQQAIQASRARMRPAPADTLVTTSWQFGAVSGGHGALRLGSAPGISVLGVLDSLGSILPGERRTLDPGLYTMTLNIDNAAPIRVTREVLPGVITTITPRPRAVMAAAETPAERAAAAADTNAALDARLGSGGSTTCYAVGAATWCWGANGMGQLGGGTADGARGPVVVAGTQSFSMVTVGASHACGLAAGGAAYCWGSGTSGQLGNGATANSATPVAVAGGQAFVAIAAGAQHTCAIGRSGAIWCWGAGATGQLGNHASANSAVPVSVSTPAGTVFRDIAAGGNHTCAVTTRGAAWCWGSGSAGELGNNSTNPAPAPVEVGGGYSFKAITAGASHTCAVRTTGQVLCWGANGSGQLGNLTNAGVSHPVPIADTTSFTQLAAGESHTCGLTPGAAAWCWGGGTSGQLGDGRMSDATRPRLVIGGLDMRALAAGASHTCAVTGDRMVWCWGANDAGQVGALAGRTNSAPLPVIARPASHRPPIGLAPRRDIRDDFTGGLRAGIWQSDSVAGDRLRADSGELVVSRTAARGVVGAAGIAMPIHLSAYNTVLRFDVMVGRNGTPGGCGLNCAAWPALVRVRVKNRDYTESEVWYGYGVSGKSGWTAGGVMLVPHDAPQGQWQRRQRIRIQDAAPRADSILEIAFGGIGTEFESRFDNISLPAITIAGVAVTPDSSRLTTAGATVQLSAVPKDSAGAPQPWATATWSSSDTAVAKVSATGLVTAVGNGSALIRASAEEGSGTAKITVRLPPARRTPVRRGRARP